MGNISQICNQTTNVGDSILDGPSPQEDKQADKYQLQDKEYHDQQYHHQIKLLFQQQQIKEAIAHHPIWKAKNSQEVYRGQFVDGVKKGTGVSYIPGKYFYLGEFNHHPDGQGKIRIYGQQLDIEGQFKKGHLEGNCKLKKFDNSINFEGTLNNKGFVSHGKLVINNQQHPEQSSQILFDNYPDNDAIITYKDGRVYTGEVNLVSFVPHGKGESVYQNQSKYVGHWSNGQFHGEGRFTWADGSWYEGSYVHGKKSGKGNFEYTSMKLYIGEWAQGKQQGQGILYSKEGQILKKGIWKEGQFVV